MAVFKVTSYTKERGGAKALIRYIQGRPGRGGGRLTRQLFGADGAMSREAAYRLMDEAKGRALFYRLVISPDPRREDGKRDLSLWEMTQKTMRTLEERLRQEIAWVAAEHNDHTENRHVHVIAVLKKRLRVNDLKFLRQTATQAALLQRQRLDLAQAQNPRLGLVTAQAQNLRRGLVTKPYALKPHSGRFSTGTHVTVTPESPVSRLRFTHSHNVFNRHLCTCPYCLTGHDKHLQTKIHRCLGCHRLLHKEPRLDLYRKEEAGWER